MFQQHRSTTDERKNNDAVFVNEGNVWFLSYIFFNFILEGMERWEKIRREWLKAKSSKPKSEVKYVKAIKYCFLIQKF